MTERSGIFSGRKPGDCFRYDRDEATGWREKRLDKVVRSCQAEGRRISFASTPEDGAKRYLTGKHGMGKRIGCKSLVAISRLAVGAIAALLMLWGPAVEAQAEAPDRPTIHAIESSNGQITVSVISYGPNIPSSLKAQWKSGDQDYDSSRQAVMEVSPHYWRTTITITGLTNGTEYTVRVIATNEDGDSLPSYGRKATPNRDPVAEADATLRSLGYSYDFEACGVPNGSCASLGNFATDRTTHSLEVRPSSELVAIAAAPRRSRATVAISPADAGENPYYHYVSLAEGENVITVTVTSEDGSTTSTHTVTVTRPPNTVPTGVPSISGSARVWERLTASMSEVSDEDGLDGATFAYQWIRTDGTTDTDIPGATRASHHLRPADLGKTIKVRTTFVDGGGTEEVLTSAATSVVEEPLTLSVANAQVRRSADATVDFTVTLSRAASHTVTVDWATADLKISEWETPEGTIISETQRGIATAGEDYTAASGSLTFGPAETSKTVSITVLSDTAEEEGGGETFALRLSNLVGANFRDSEATGTILNDAVQGDTDPPSVSVRCAVVQPVDYGLQVSDSNSVWWEFQFSEPVTESGDGGPYTLTSQDGFAVPGVFVWDFVGLGNLGKFHREWRFGGTPMEPGPGNILSDANGVIVSVPAGEWRDEAGNPNTASGASLYLAHNWQVSVADASAVEGTDETIDFEVTLNARDDCKTVTVDWTTADGSAVAGEDYTSANGTLTFAPGETSKTVSIAVLDDTVEDSDETFTLQLSNASTVTLTGVSLTLADTQATGTIFNDEVVPLTARFENVPDSHDGSTAFTFEVHFSEDIPGLSYETVADGLFEVTGGNVTKASRTTQGSNQGWLVTVAPSGSGSKDIAISLPVRACGETAAICTADNRALAGAISATVPRVFVTASQTSGEGLRLVGGATANEGRLEMLLDGQWGTVCDDYWGKADADVACRALGYEEGSVADATQFMRAYFGAGAQSMPIWLDNVQCAGTETSLLACPRRHSPAVGVHNCRHREDVGVRCAGERSASAGVETPAVPLTAELRNVPAEHDGSSSFEVEVVFSEAPEISYTTVRDRMFAVSGGSITAARRSDRGSNLKFKVTVTPSGYEAVGLSLATLPACGQRHSICTSDGRALQGPINATVPGPVTLSVADAEVDEAQGATLDFAVTLSRARTAATTVDYATSDGTATAGSDYEAASGTLTFAAGETEKTVSVGVLDDALDEGSETLSLTLSNPNPSTVRLADAEATGTIENSDPLQKMWLSRFGRTVASHVTEAVSDRLSNPLGGAQVTVGGQRVDLAETDDEAWLGRAMTSVARALGAPDGPEPEGGPGLDRGQAGAGGWPGTGLGASSGSGGPTARDLSGRELLLGSAFHLAKEGDGTGPGLAAWGRVTAGGFDGEAPADGGRVRIDGEVTTGILGADAEWNRVLAGVAVSVSEGEGRFDQPGVDSGTIESTMTTVSPYARLMVTDRVSVWGLAGWGTGDMTIVQVANDRGQPERVTRTDLAMRLAAVGGRGALLEADEADGIDLALNADAFWVETESEAVSNEGDTTGEASRVRLVLEGGRAFALGGGATLRPSLELGLRHDGGDAETGTGVELGGGVSYADPASGLSVEAKARMLVAHADSDYEEWGVSGSVRLAPGARGRGLSFSLSPTLGAASSGAERLWGARDAGGLAPGGEFEAARGLDAELGYGLPLFGDRFTGTPNLGFGLSNGGARNYRLGWRLTSVVPNDPGFEVDLDATRREAANGNEPPEHGVMLRGAIRW